MHTSSVDRASQNGQPALCNNWCYMTLTVCAQSMTGPSHESSAVWPSQSTVVESYGGRSCWWNDARRWMVGRSAFLGSLQVESGWGRSLGDVGKPSAVHFLYPMQLQHVAHRDELFPFRRVLANPDGMGLQAGLGRMSKQLAAHRGPVLNGDCTLRMRERMPDASSVLTLLVIHTQAVLIHRTSSSYIVEMSIATLSQLRIPGPSCRLRPFPTAIHLCRSLRGHRSTLVQGTHDSSS